MRTLVILPAALLLCLVVACQTASYKEGTELAGTDWKATDQSTDPRTNFQELQFGSKLAPSGMGQVRTAAGKIVLFQVVDGKLLMKATYLEGKLHHFTYDIDGDKMTLTAITADGQTLGVQHFVKQ